jgi:biotin transporter BioY
VLAIVYAPGILAPTLWGILSPLVQWLRKQTSLESLFLFASALTIALAPFSTFREPLGITRLASGMVLSGLLQAARLGKKSLLHYAWVGLAYLPFIAG